MSRWYRISLSLAAKCRLGFAAAVLLIIGAALFVPYRWMDKLVEQGKRELAASEVQHVLERHFHLGSEDMLIQQVPPLAWTEEGVIKPGQWSSEDENVGGGVGRRVFLPAPGLGTGGEEGVIEGQAARSRPVVRWVRVPGGVGASDIEQILRRQVKGVAVEDEGGEGVESGGVEPSGSDSEAGEVAAEGEAGAESEVEEGRIKVTGDAFELQGVHKFLTEKDRDERFRMHYRMEGGGVSGVGGLEGQREEVGFGGVGFWNQPARYLRAVRADKGCLGGGCHGGGVQHAEQAVTEGGPPVFQEGELVGVVSVILPAGGTETTLVFNRIFIVVAGFLASVTAMVAFYLITQRFILQPVRSLREATEKVVVPEGEQQDSVENEQASWQEAMGITDKIRTGDEFEKLAEAFHQMLGRLKLAHDRLRETNRALDMQLGELQARNIALFESNKLKSEFLANVSHELRTPLNAIIGFAEIIRDKSEGLEDSKTERYASNILESGKGLLSIINDLLDLAKVEAGKMEVRWEQCSVAEIVEALFNFSRPLTEEKELIVNVAVDEKIGLIETDPGKLQQILFNLLNNAIAFTPRGGRIDIKATLLESDYIRIKVSDTGPGIAVEDRETIFEKFRQIDASVTREHSGTGLGLAIVKELVEIMGGSISVGGEVGKGAEFTVMLPMKRYVVDE